ncbi:MAG: MBL fold metallo-hydrolase [Lysobacterales bacterium]
MRKLILTITVFALASSAFAADGPINEFITLGTAAGPNSQATRSQPANALVVNEDLYLVDAGDGAVQQLVKAGFRVQDLDGVFISHNHFDHIGGMLAVLGLQSQLGVRKPLKVYGPPGTKALVDGLVIGMTPAMTAAFGMPNRSWRSNVQVEEVVHNSVIELAGVTVRVAENSHFAIPQESGFPEKAKALSFRFNLADRSIVYTGDTGPSEALQTLAKGADLLVSEMMDIDSVLANIRAENPDMPQRQFDGIEWHLRAHHLLPIQVGELASGAKVKSLVVTHMSPNVSSDEMAKRYLNEIADAFDGQAVIADDLDRF